LTEPSVLVTIVADSTSQRCSGNCAGDWSFPDALDLARQRISERFGDRAVLELVDLSSPSDSPHVRKIKASVQGMPLPVLLANGRPRIAGEFDIRQLLDVIEAGLEVEL
jgi:hypothetical protein